MTERFSISIGWWSYLVELNFFKKQKQLYGKQLLINVKLMTGVSDGSRWTCSLTDDTKSSPLNIAAVIYFSTFTPKKKK